MTETRCSDRPSLPVGKIVCVGRNYAAHAAEMGADRPSEPVLFLKPSTALLAAAAPIVLPPFSREVHHEVELVVRIGRDGKDLGPSDATAALDAFGVGLDLTARDLQAAAKSAGLPWAVAKGWDGAAPLSPLRPLGAVAEVVDLPISLERNGEVVQSARTSQMLLALPELVAFASSRFSLQAGDLLFTGTPAGVGPLAFGDQLRARLGDLTAEWTVTASPRSTMR